jgi:hypothetical protein
MGISGASTQAMVGVQGREQNTRNAKAIAIIANLSRNSNQV